MTDAWTDAGNSWRRATPAPILNLLTEYAESKEEQVNSFTTHIDPSTLHSNLHVPDLTHFLPTVMDTSNFCLLNLAVQEKAVAEYIPRKPDTSQT